MLDQAEQVQQAATQPVQLGDQHHLDLARRGRREQLLQRRARRYGSGHAGIQVLADQHQTMRAGQGPALLALRVDRRRVHLGAGRDPQIAHRARQPSTRAPARTARRTHDRHPRMPAAPMPTPGLAVRPIVERLCRPWSSPTATTEWLPERPQRHSGRLSACRSATFRGVDDPERPSERLVEQRMRNRAMEALVALSEATRAFVAWA